MVGPWDDQRRQQPPAWIQPRYSNRMVRGLPSFVTMKMRLLAGLAISNESRPTAPLERMSRRDIDDTAALTGAAN